MLEILTASSSRLRASCIKDPWAWPAQVLNFFSLFSARLVFATSKSNRLRRRNNPSRLVDLLRLFSCLMGPTTFRVQQRTPEPISSVNSITSYLSNWVELMISPTCRPNAAQGMRLGLGQASANKTRSRTICIAWCAAVDFVYVMRRWKIATDWLKYWTEAGKPTRRAFKRSMSEIPT
jgi:hypothetical protein